MLFKVCIFNFSVRIILEVARRGILHAVKMNCVKYAALNYQLAANPLHIPADMDQIWGHGLQKAPCGLPSLYLWYKLNPSLLDIW